MTNIHSRSWLESAAGLGDPTGRERYVIKAIDGYLGLDRGTHGIDIVADVSQAWWFHTHEKAVTTARQLSALRGRLLDVMRLN